MSDDDVYDEDPAEEEESDEDYAESGEEEEFSGNDDTFMDDDEEGEDSSEAAAPARPRRRAPSRPGTIGGVARSRLDKPEHALKAWEELSAHIDEEIEPVPYSIRDSYEKEQRVDHPTFGIGHVVEISGPTKIEVLFQDALRKLVQNR